MPWWLIPNVFGLDAPVVATLWLWVLAQSDGLRLPPSFYWALGLFVWCIYLLDRVIDGHRFRKRIRAGLKPSELASIPLRHRYSASHPRLFILLLAPVALTLGWIALLKLPFQSFVLPAIGVSSFVWLYIGLSATFIGNKTRGLFILLTLITGLFGAAHFSPIMRAIFGFLLVVACILQSRQVGWGASSGTAKGLMCGVIFATGVALPLLLRSIRRPDELLTNPEWLILSALFSLNCIGIYLAEEDNVEKSGGSLNSRNIRHFFIPVCILLASVAIGISIFVIDFPATRAFFVLAGVSTLLLAAVFWKYGHRPSELHRVLADVALIVPPLLFLLAASS